MNETLFFAAVIGLIMLALATVLMPFAVFAIADRLKRVEKILAAMESMMRNGK
jgi:hypothetical protein